MNYTVYTEYLNGARGDKQTFETKDAAYSYMIKAAANTDLHITASALVIKTYRREIYRHQLQNAHLSAIPQFSEIPWPRRGREAVMKDGVTISVVVEREDLCYLKKLGCGVTSHGVRRAVTHSRAVDGIEGKSE